MKFECIYTSENISSDLLITVARKGFLMQKMSDLFGDRVIEPENVVLCFSEIAEFCEEINELVMCAFLIGRQVEVNARMISGKN